MGKYRQKIGSQRIENRSSYDETYYFTLICVISAKQSLNFRIPTLE